MYAFKRRPLLQVDALPSTDRAKTNAKMWGTELRHNTNISNRNSAADPDIQCANAIPRSKYTPQ